MRSAAEKYALAVGVLAAAVGLRWLLDPWLGDTLPFVTLFGAVAYAVWIGGYRPAALVVVLGYLAVDYLFISSRGRLALAGFADGVGLTAYLFTSALIVAFGEATRRATRRATERRELLQVTLRSIGDAVITTDTSGRVTYLNAVAEALTGWTQRDALGQPLDAVFRIVNQDSRSQSRVRRRRLCARASWSDSPTIRSCSSETAGSARLTTAPHRFATSRARSQDAC